MRTNHEDTDGLAAVIESSAPYIALLGSRTKVKTLKQRMLDRGVSPEIIAGIRAPVGLDIGAETPVEIAVSIMAEILMERNERSGRPMKDSIRNGGSNLVVIRGAGDMATGTAIRLKRSGFQVAMLDITDPTVIRTSVSFAQAMFVDEAVEVEGIKARKANSVAEAWRLLEAGTVPVLIDPKGETLRQFKPGIVIDSILAKKNLGTSRDMAPLTIALGPGFSAGEDVDAVVETNRGHNLGRVILEGSAAANTGVPGNIAGYTEERIIRAPSAGEMQPLAVVGDLVEEGQVIARVGEQVVTARIAGKVRGMLNPGIEITEGFKIGDIDPRGEEADHMTVSDKARAVAGGVLEAIMMFRN